MLIVWIKIDTSDLGHYLFMFVGDRRPPLGSWYRSHPYLGNKSTDNKLKTRVPALFVSENNLT